MYRVRDYLGNEYKSLKELTERYGMDYFKVRTRVLKGISTEQITEEFSKNGKILDTPYLSAIKQTTKTTPIPTHTCTDHLGNKYRFIKEMCRHYKIEYETYLSRRNKGWTVEEALTLPTGQRNSRLKHNCTTSGIPCVDYLGNTYNSYTEMCKAYGISNVLFAKRKSRGYTLEECLAPVHKQGDYPRAEVTKNNLLSEKHKDLYDMWDAEKNGCSIEDSTKLRVYSTYYWKCDKGHSFKNMVNSLLVRKKTSIGKKSLCPICNKELIRDGSYLGKKIMCIETGKVYNSFRKATEDTGVHHSQIMRYLNGEVKCPSKLKYTWRLINDD